MESKGHKEYCHKEVTNHIPSVFFSTCSIVPLVLSFSWNNSKDANGVSHVLNGSPFLMPSSFAVSSFPVPESHGDDF